MEGRDQAVVMEEKLPPGFRFHPTDEELITYYLINKISDANFTARAVADVDLNKCEPWDLPGKAKMGEKEWYFFSLRDRKYPTGVRTNRATTTGYWKTTGKDKEIYNSNTSELVGMKKTLVFYKGRAPRGEKSNWVMHEYRFHSKSAYRTTKQDEWVVCRVFQKSGGGVKKLYSSNQLSRAVINNPNYHYTNEILLPHSNNNNNNNPMQLLPQLFIQPPPPPPPPDNNNFHFPSRNYYSNIITPPHHNHIQDFNKVFNAASTSTAVNYAAGGGGGCFTISGLNLNLGGGAAAAQPPLMNQQINVGSCVHEGAGGGYDHHLIDGGNTSNNNNRFMDQCGDLDNYWPSFN